MDIIEKYKRCRQIAKRMNTQILDKCNAGSQIKSCASMLGILKNMNVVFNDEPETDYLFDFIIHEKHTGDKNFVEIYYEKYGDGETGEEQEVLQAFRKSYTCLFKVQDASAAEGSVILQNYYNPDNNVKIIDLMFSNHCRTNLIIFTRIIPFDDFNMTSGSTFIFGEDAEMVLSQERRRIERKLMLIKDEDAKRFGLYFWLNRAIGQPVLYQ